MASPCTNIISSSSFWTPHPFHSAWKITLDQQINRWWIHKTPRTWTGPRRWYGWSSQGTRWEQPWYPVPKFCLLHAACGQSPGDPGQGNDCCYSSHRHLGSTQRWTSSLYKPRYFYTLHFFWKATWCYEKNINNDSFILALPLTGWMTLSRLFDISVSLLSCGK